MEPREVRRSLLPKPGRGQKLFEQLLIRCGKGVIGQLIAPNPGEIVAPDNAWFVTPPKTSEEFQQDSLPGIVMRNGFEQLFDLHLDPKLLHQLAPETILRRLCRFLLAAGKLPQTAQMILRPALAYEQKVIAKNKTGGNLDQITRRAG